MRVAANPGTRVDARTIDIFVSSPADVQKEQALAEQLIRSAAAEFNLQINVSFSNPLRGSKAQNGGVGGEDFDHESALVLCPCFWEYPDPERDGFVEQVPNTGQYDLVICILWSRLGIAPLHNCVMPDGSRPASATDYEIAWALDQSKWTAGFPRLHIYRNRATPTAPLEPKEKRENLLRHWDAVPNFFAEWEKNAGREFCESCHDYQDLEEFENLFREHFRDFLARQLDRETGLSNGLRRVRHWESNPFRGLNFFDFEHAALYHGRTRAVGEVLDALKNQATAKKRFVLVLGPSGSGKSSLVRAGVLPLLTRGGTPVGDGPWRRALTRPGAADPFDALAAALVAKFCLPELQEGASSAECSSLASQLRKDPDRAAARIAEVLDQLTRLELDHLLDQRKTGALKRRRSQGVEAAFLKSLGEVKPQMQLALVVDQLEELFTGVCPVLQQRYITALCALANCEGVFIIATLCSDFYPHYQRFPELVKLTAAGGTYELQPPTPRGIGNMIRWRADAAGLRFERDPETGRSLDEALVKAAIATPEPLPLLENVLSRLYERQLARKDGLLLWSDYRGLGGLLDALAQHAEFVFLTLKPDEHRALRFVIRHLLAPGRSEEVLLNRRTVPYRDLVSSPKLTQRQRQGVKGLVDRLIKEGLLSADTDPNQELLVSIPQEALLRRWPQLWQALSKDQHFFQMRDRLDTSLKLWLVQGRRSDDLLDRGIGLVEAETLLRDFGSLLSKSQTDYIQKSLARQKRRRWVRVNVPLAALVGSAAVVAFSGVELFNTESRRYSREQDVEQAQQNTDLANKLEIQLRQAQEKLRLAQHNADLAATQRSELDAELKKTQDKLQLAQQNADLVASQRTALDAELKKTQDKLQLAQQNADLAANQRSALDAELKKTQDKLQLAQQNADLAASQRTALDAELKKTQDELQLAQQNADLAASQRSELQTELKKTQDKLQLAQQNTNLVTSQRIALETERIALETQRSALETERKKTEEKLRLAQQNADLAATRRSELQTELKKVQQELQQAQQNADLAASQRSELQTELKKVQQELQQAEQNALLAASQRIALETELNQAQQKLQLAQRSAVLAASQRSELQTELNQAHQKLQLAQQNAHFVAAQRSQPQTELETAQEEKAQLTQQNTGLANKLETQLKKAELNLPQDDSPIPSPPLSKESKTPNFPESQFDRSIEADRDKELLKEFVLGYLRTVAINDTSIQRPYFAVQVNFYGRGVLDSSSLEASTQRYHEEWPIRKWAPRGEAKVVQSKNPNLFLVYQPFTWNVSDGSQHSHGNAVLFFRIRKSSEGGFRIVHVEQLDR